MNIEKYKYALEPLMITIPNSNEPIKINIDRVHEILIDRDFDNNIMPFISISMSLDKSDHILILNNLNKAKVSFKLTKIRYNNDRDMNFKQSFIDCTYNIMTSGVAMNNASEIDELSEETKNKSEQNRSDQMISVKFILFNSQVFSRFKKTHNIVGDNLTATAILGYIFGASGFRYLMSPIDNKLSRRVIIPEDSVQDIVEYVHRNIGIYNTGYRLFNDIDDILYFLNNSRDTKAFKPNEIENIYFDVNNISGNSGITYGSYVDNGALKINIGAKDVEYKTTSAATKEMNPTKIRAINGSNMSSSSSNVNGFDTGDTHLIVDDKRNNPYYINSLLHQNNESNLKVIITARELDISYITANKKYNINYIDDVKLNKAYAGTYKCSRVMTYLEREDGFLVGNTAIQLKRV